MVTARKLVQYFQGHPIVDKINYPIKWIFKRPDLEVRMIAWVVELFEYDITYTPINNINSQVLADLLIELSSPTLEEIP